MTFVPDHDGGDTNFGGSVSVDIQVTVDRWFSPTGVGVSALVKISCVENGGDNTSASTFKMTNLYTPDAGYSVDKLVIASNTTDHHYVHGNNPSDIDSFDMGGEGPVRRLEIEGLNGGDGGAGGRNRVKITFNPIRMIVIQQGNCVPPS